MVVIVMKSNEEYLRVTHGYHKYHHCRSHHSQTTFELSIDFRFEFSFQYACQGQTYRWTD